MEVIRAVEDFSYYHMAHKASILQLHFHKSFVMALVNICVGAA